MDCKEIQPVHSEGDQPWDFFGRTLDCSPLGSSDNGISQPRILEWVAISSSRGHPQTSPPPLHPQRRRAIGSLRLNGVYTCCSRSRAAYIRAVAPLTHTTRSCIPICWGSPGAWATLLGSTWTLGPCCPQELNEALGNWNQRNKAAPLLLAQDLGQVTVLLGPSVSPPCNGGSGAKVQG